MKLSQFNTTVPYHDKFHLFNSFTQKFILIDPLLKEMLDAAKNDGVEELKNFHPSFYEYLIDEEFILPDEINEVDKVKALSKLVDENNNSFLLTINPTMNCNFKCWYCYESHVKNSNFSSEMQKRVGLFIEKTTSTPGINLFSIAFFGGEPLLYFKKDVAPIILKQQAECEKNNVNYSVSFTTNGFLINDDFIDFFKSNGISPAFQITLDGYKEKHDEVRFVNASRGSYEDIVTNIKKLLANRFLVRVRVNYTSENLNDTEKIADEFNDISPKIKRDYLLMDFHRVWQDCQNDDIKEIVEEKLEKIRAKDTPAKYIIANNVVESCYADKRNSAVINYNGDLFKCTARDFTTVKRAGYINEYGELIWENNYLEKRMNVKFKNKPCLSCKLLPMCNGGCSQHALEALEAGEEYCIYYGDEKAKDDVVRAKIDEISRALETNEV